MRRIILSLLIVSFQMNLLAQNGKENKVSDDFFEKIRKERIISDPSVEWQNFGPGMSGYCEEYWCHPNDTNVMFMSPDMHVSYGTWDNGKSWQTIKDSDGLGQEMKRVLDMEFSRQDPDYGMAIDWNGWLYETLDRGHTWTLMKELGKSYQEKGVDAASFRNWYYEQLGSRHSELAVDPTNDNIWFVGAGDFWNVKSNHKSLEHPNGVSLNYADYGHIWKTTNKGRTWDKITNGLAENTDVAKIIVNPNFSDSVIMATNNGLLISGDGGHSWSDSSNGLPNNLPRDLCSYYNPQTKEFILYLLEQTVYESDGRNSVRCKGGIYRSLDGGKSWESITGNLAIDLSSLNNEQAKAKYYRAIAYWFGVSVKEAMALYPKVPDSIYTVFNRILVNPLNPEELYIANNIKHDYSFPPGDVWKTTDSGKNWVACTRVGKYWREGSDDEYWKARNNPLGMNTTFAHMQRDLESKYTYQGNRFVEANANGDIFICIDQQVLRSDNNGATWKQVDDDETAPGSKKWVGRGGSNLPGRYMLLETGIPERKLLCSGEHGLWETTNLGDFPDENAIAVKQIEGQVRPEGAVSISTVAVHPQNPDIIYLLSWRQEHRGKLRRSIDAGKSWENIATIFEADNPIHKGLAPQYCLTIDPINPDNMYFCSVYKNISEIGPGYGRELTRGGYGFYRSFDGGYTWELSNNGFHSGASVRRIAMHPNNPEILYAALNDKNGGLFRTSDKGTTWNRVNIPESIRAVNNVYVDRNNKNIYICAGWPTGTYEEGGVWKSTDDGASWQKIFKAPFVWQVESSPLNPDLIVISVAGQNVSLCSEFMNPGIYLSQDQGITWRKINKNLGQPDKIVDVKPDPYNENILWCASWGCGWYRAFINDM